MHAFKKCLRVKSNINDYGQIQQWCRLAIVLDSDIDDIKYVLELKNEGFVKSEYMTWVLEKRTQGTIFGIKRLISSLTVAQSFRLRLIADQLCSILSVESGNYKRLFEVDAGLDPKEEDQEKMPKIRKPKKGKDTDFNFIGDAINKAEGSEDSESEEEDLNYIEMVRVALRATRA